MVNLVGITPDTLDDQDSVPIGDLGANTVCVSGDGTDCSWTLRTLGAGRIAYVSTDDDEDIDWLDTGATGTGAYNGALRNFVFNASNAFITPHAVPTLSIWGLGIMSLLLAFVARRKAR